MPDQRPQDRPRISVEQLLQLKRSERPAPSFWEDFDRELRRRQLACIVAGQPWYVRFIRSMTAGFRRIAPVGVAAAAAIAGFLVWQRHPNEVIPTVTQAAMTDASSSTVPVVSFEVLPAAAPDPLETLEFETPAPVFIRPAVGEPRFVVHEFVASTNPSRTFISVTSPNTFSSPAYDASLQMVNTLTSGYATRRAATHSGAGSF
jgi:hypothetical protein